MAICFHNVISHSVFPVDSEYSYQILILASSMSFQYFSLIYYGTVFLSFFSPLPFGGHRCSTLSSVHQRNCSFQKLLNMAINYVEERWLLIETRNLLWIKLLSKLKPRACDLLLDRLYLSKS